jgi:hypothetical protein
LLKHERGDDLLEVAFTAGFPSKIFGKRDRRATVRRRDRAEEEPE